MRRHHRVFVLIALMVMAVALTSCALRPGPEEKLTPIEKAKKTGIWMMDTYSAQYDDYQAMVAKPDLTDAQKQILKVKYEVLKEAEPLIKAFNASVDTGTLPSPELESRIMDLLTRLQNLTTH